MRKIYNYKTKKVTVYPVNESASELPFCLYIDEVIGDDTERIKVDDKFYATEEEATDDIFEVTANYLKEFNDIDPGDVDYVENEDGTVEFSCEGCPKKWIVGVMTNDIDIVPGNEETDVAEEEEINENVDDNAEEKTDAVYDALRSLLHELTVTDVCDVLEENLDFETVQKLVNILYENTEYDLDKKFTSRFVLDENGNYRLYVSSDYDDDSDSDEEGFDEYEEIEESKKSRKGRKMNESADADKALAEISIMIKSNDGLSSDEILDNIVDYATGLKEKIRNEKNNYYNFQKGVYDELKNIDVRYIKYWTSRSVQHELKRLYDEEGILNPVAAAEALVEFIVNNDYLLGESKNESVASRFSKMRSMFEGLNEDEDDEDESDEVEDKENDEDEKKDDENDDEFEEKEMKAVVLTVKKDDAEKLKEQLIDAGCDEEDIEIIEDEEDENSKVRVDVKSIMELKDYLDKKGIDLEKEIGGEIVSDEDDEDDEDEEDAGEDEDEEKKDGEKSDEEEFDFDNLGDIFGAEDEE